MAGPALCLSSHRKCPSFVASCKFTCEWPGDSVSSACLGLGYSSSPRLLNPEGQASVVHPGMGKEVQLFVGLF